MENFDIAIQLLILVIVTPCLVLFYCFVLFRILAFLIKIIKHIWYSSTVY